MQRTMLKGNRMRNALEPAIHNLIFIHASEETIQTLKKTRPELQYMMRKMDGKAEKIIVPKQQMEDFMKVCTESPDFVEIISADDVQFRPGQEVLVVSGPLSGVRGYFQRTTGHRSRSLIINIPGVCAATMKVKAEEITPVGKD